MKARYCPEYFDAGSLQQAREVILTDEGAGADTESRWALETPYVLELVQHALALRPEMLVLDYGCGVGRMAKAMIEATGCAVIGVDTSANMRRFAAEYVGSDRFTAVSPGQLDCLVGAGLREQAAISVWVLQHCFCRPTTSHASAAACWPAAGFFVLNMNKRALPAVIEAEGSGHGIGEFVWAADEVDVAKLLRAAFQLEMEGVPDKSRTPNMADAAVYWMALR